MNSWINLTALWKIVVIGLLAGAGLPALFAVGIRALSPPSAARADASAATPGRGAARGTGAGPLGYLVAGVCFAAVLAAIGWGIDLIVSGS